MFAGSLVTIPYIAFLLASDGRAVFSTASGGARYRGGAVTVAISEPN
jgi:hypothetical protein